MKTGNRLEHVQEFYRLMDILEATVGGKRLLRNSNAPREIRQRELEIERSVSDYIGRMPFLWLEINDPAGPGSLRGLIERNTIALLSNLNQIEVFDPASKDWLGHSAANKTVHQSGLWKVRHADEKFDDTFLIQFENAIEEKLEK